MPPSSMDDLFSFLTQLMTEHASLFETMGAHMYRGFAVIMIVWFGVKTALASAGGGRGATFHFDQFAALLLTIAFGFGMITFYSNPIPGFGVSFYHLIIDEGLALSNQLNHALVQEIWNRLTGLYFGMETPALSLAINVLELIRYLVTVLCILAAQAAVFGVIAFGYVAAAVAVMLGPIFIPFFIVPHMEWLFWGWLKSLIQYAFYPVVANAYLFVFGNLLIHFVDSHPPPYDGAAVAVFFFPLVLLLIAFTYGILKIPSLVNSLFTGRSGEAAIPSFL
jgi:type IV secretory pathway VirB6-like protein